MSRISRAEGPENHLRPWSKEHLQIIAAYTPTWRNAHFLAEKLGRTPHAIQYQWCKLYKSMTDLKKWAAEDPRGQVYLDIRKEDGFAIHV